MSESPSVETRAMRVSRDPRRPRATARLVRWSPCGDRKASRARLPDVALADSLELPPSLGRAEVFAELVAGRGVLSLEDLRGLAPGDTVRIVGLGWHARRLVGAACLRTAAFEGHGVLFPRGLELSRFQTFLPSKERPMSDDPSHPFLPVEVEVELTRLSLRISQLATLRPGAVVPLRIDDRDPVSLKIGGRTIARAELVDLEGEVGARILRLVDREDAP